MLAHLQIINNYFSTLDGVLPNLQTVDDDILLSNNVNLATLDGFQNLQLVRGHVDIYRNARLTIIGTGFSNLQSVEGHVNWNQNGPNSANNRYDSTAGSRSFCASARGALCPTTTRYLPSDFADDAHACCTAYCGANRVNC